MAFEPITTTLNRMYACNPCQDGWKRGLAAAGKTQPDDEPITYAQILDAVGLKDALWACRAEPQYAHLWRLYGILCARRVQSLMTDTRSVAALDVAERYANGQATDAELAAAGDAARDAAMASLAWNAASAAWAVAWADAGASVRAAAWEAASAARADAGASAWEAASATWNAERQAQADAFRQLVTTGTLPD